MSSGSAGLVHLRGIDVIDGTPILDIKPFVPYEALGATSEAAPPASLRFPQWLLEDGRRVAPLRTVEIAPGAALHRLRKALDGVPSALSVGFRIGNCSFKRACLLRLQQATHIVYGMRIHTYHHRVMLQPPSMTYYML